MLFNTLRLIELFCQIDDFVASFERFIGDFLLGTGTPSPHPVSEPNLSQSEMMTIEIMYHLSGYKCFEYYYVQYVKNGSIQENFPKAPSYSRFVQLKPRLLPVMVIYLLCSG